MTIYDLAEIIVDEPSVYGSNTAPLEVAAELLRLRQVLLSASTEIQAWALDAGFLREVDIKK